MKVWITKYALDSGIVEANISISELRKDCLYKSIRLPYGTFDGMVDRNDIHESKESAIVKAEEMRQKKIESLKKQIKKLDGMKFD